MDFNEKFYRPPNFCSVCGELFTFRIIKAGCVLCSKCGAATPMEYIENHFVETNVNYHYYEEILERIKHNEAILNEGESKDKRPIIEETCPKCGYSKMYYTTMQTRSADEGTTVFYECIKCHYKFTLNN